MAIQMPILNKEGLVKAVAADTGLSNAEVAKVVESLQETIISTVASGQEVKLMGFLSIEPTVRAPRSYKNPRTGEEIEVGESSSIRVRTMKHFRDRVSDSSNK